MKYYLLISFLLLVFGSIAAPQLQGYEFKSILEFGPDVKARVAKDCFYTAERFAGNKIVVTKYDLKCKYVSAETIDIMADQNDYKTFSIVDFEVGWNGQVVVIGQGNKTDNLKKQKCYLIHYTPGSSIIAKEIEDRIYLYQNLLFENGVFYFCAAAGEVESNGHYEIWRNSYKYVQGSKELSSEVIFDNSKEDLDITESSIWAKNCWYSGDRYVISQHTTSPLNVTINYNRLTFPGSNGVTEYVDRSYLHQVEVYDFSPFGEWFIAFCSHQGNNGWISEAYTSDGKLIQFGNEPFQDIFIDPETKTPCLITTKGVYRILVTYDQAVKMAEKKMLSELFKWKTRGPLETESEVNYRVGKYGQKFSDSTLTAEVNKLLPIMNLGVYNEAKFQAEFNSLRLKLTTLDDYFYTVNWNSSQTNFEEPILKKLLIEYEQGKPVLKGFDYAIKSKSFVARRLLPPKIMKESIYIEKVTDFEARFTIDFISKSKNNAVRFLVDDVPVTPSVKGLGNDQFQVAALVKFTAHTAKLKMVVACELGDTVFEYKLECENIYDSKGKDCFTAYYDELATGYVNPIDLVEAMNVCIIVSNSNFYQADSSIAGEIPLAENIQQAQILQNILVTNYHYKNEQVFILEDQTKQQMDELFVRLENIEDSDYISTKGASKINLMLVVLSHGSGDNKLITSDNKKFDISKAIVDLNYKTGFNNYVQDFLYIEDMCFGSFKQDKTLRGNKIDMSFKPDFCHYADKGSKVGVMSSLDGSKVAGSVFIRNFNKALEANKNSEVVTLETILMTMVTNKDLPYLPLILKLYQDIGNTKAQKSFYFFTDKYLQIQIH